MVILEGGGKYLVSRTLGYEDYSISHAYAETNTHQDSSGR